MLALRTSRVPRLLTVFDNRTCRHLLAAALYLAAVGVCIVATMPG